MSTDPVAHFTRVEKLNKAGYTATLVACGWAGAIFLVTRPFGQEQRGQKIKIIKKVKCDQPTDGRTDGRTDKVGCRVALHTTKKRQEEVEKLI